MSKPDEKWLDQFSSVDNLKDLAAAQQNTIIQQSKKITELERELESRSGSTSLTPAEFRSEGGAKDAEFIANNEISKLKYHSLTRELTIEESKKLETFVKVLGISPPKDDTIDVSSVSSHELLASLDEK